MTVPAPLQKTLAKKTILLDGGWGTEFQKRGLPVGEQPDMWNLERPEIVLEVARSYVEAGSDVVLTNTFGSNRFVLEKLGAQEKAYELNKRGAEISVEATSGTETVVVASVGPTGVMLALGAVPESAIYEAYLEQMRGLRDGGVSGVVVETSSDPAEARQAILAAKELDLFVAVSAVFDSGKKKDRTMMGAKPEQYVELAESTGADAVGSNCGRGIESFVEICERMRAATKLPIWMKGNAGLPQTVDGVATYSQTPSEFADGAIALVELGATFIGGCCGTNPEFIKELRARLDARA